MQKKQFGRSMIEMLGVLAIIGVLSIGGLLGYRRAVNNHQANVILDDVNRFAFVILERSGLALDAEIDKGDFVESGIYTLEGYQDIEPNQFSITVSDVPDGVCEALLPKAAVGYKVRVNEHGTDVQGMVYDAKYQDLCQGVNDVVLYFGDTAGVCNPADLTKEEANCGGCRCDDYCVVDSVTGEDVCCPAGQKAVNGSCSTQAAGQACSENSDCTADEFCGFENPNASDDKGDGQCIKMADYTIQITTMSDGRTYLRAIGKTMNWYSAQSFCASQRKSDGSVYVPVKWNDLCPGWVSNPCTSSILGAMVEKWGGNHWLNERDGETAFYSYFQGLNINATRKDNRIYALCH